MPINFSTVFGDLDASYMEKATSPTVPTQKPQAKKPKSAANKKKSSEVKKAEAVLAKAQSVLAKASQVIWSGVILAVRSIFQVFSTN